jgi:polyisoprenoid-binding protein YceI
MRLLATFALFALAQAAQASVPAPPVAPVPKGQYTIDKPHASLIFRVNHMGFSTFTARFTSFDAGLQLDPANMTASRAAVTIDPASIESDNAPDGFLDMLRGNGWLDAAKFPEITFKSRTVETAGPNALRVHGDLTLHGVTRPIVLEARYNGGYAGHPMDPHARVGFSAHGSFKRSDFGVSAGVPVPGSFGVGDEVEVILEAEFSGPALAKAGK